MKKIILTTVLLLSTIGLFAELSSRWQKAYDNPDEFGEYYITETKEVGWAYISEENMYLVMYTDLTSRLCVSLFYHNDSPLPLAQSEKHFDMYIEAASQDVDAISLYNPEQELSFKVYHFY